MPNRFNTGCGCCGCPDAVLDAVYTPASPWNYTIHTTVGSPNRNGGQITYGSNGQTIRLVFGFVDDDNYAFVEAVVESAPDANDGTFHLGTRSGGVELSYVVSEYPTVRASDVTGSYRWHIFGSLNSAGILVGGIAGTLPYFPADYVYAIGLDVGLASGKTGYSSYIAPSGPYGPAAVDTEGCPDSYQTCCNSVSPYPLSDNVTPTSLTINIDAGADPWTGAWVIPLSIQDYTSWRFPCYWYGDGSGTYPFSITANFRNHGSYEDLLVQIISWNGAVYTYSFWTTGFYPLTACVNWSGLVLQRSNANKYLASVTVDAN